MGKNGKNRGDYNNRQHHENGEELPVVSSDAPAGRFQTEGQVSTVSNDSAASTGSKPSGTIETDSIPAQVVHTKKVSDLVRGKDGVGGLSGSTGALGFTNGSYSGKADIIGDMSATPVVGKPDRSPTRTGKKLDSTLKHINYLYNEQVTVNYDESKPLAENKDAVQGYNGTYFNEHARTQKRSGFVPAELYYDRSVDEIHQDFIYPIMGQSINDPAPSSIKSYDPDAESGYSAFSCQRGNFIHTKLNVSFDSKGNIDKFYFDVLDITPDTQPAEVANVSAVNSIIDANTAEIDRQNMDAKAGNESLPGWSPIPRSIKEPTATVGLVRDLEASVGAEVFMAYKKTAAAFSYQLSKTAKDGQRVTEPITEMLTGCMSDHDSFRDPTVIGSVDTYENAFTVNNYLHGSPALMIEIFDSVSKYNTKGDLLLQPRGFKMHLQTADNNMNVLHVPSKFVQAVNSNEVFSTIDKEYDPFMPVCISDKATLAHPYNLNDFIDADNGYVSKPFRYAYVNNSNNAYMIEVHHPLIAGLRAFFNQYRATIFKAIGSKAGVIKIPCIHSTTGFSLWSLLLLASTPFMIKSRVTSFIDFLDYEKNFGYPFSQLISMKDANPMAAKNYSNSSYDEPLSVGVMSTATAMKWVFPETYWIHRENSSSPKVVMPWYHNQLQYEFVEGEGVKLGDYGCVMSMPSIRSGSRLGFFDTIYSMSERDIRLCLDRQTIVPAASKVTELRAYKYGISTDGQVEVTLPASEFTFLSIYKTPREMGWVIPALNGSLTQAITDIAVSNNGVVLSYSTSRLNADGDSSSTQPSSDMDTYAPGSFRIRYWQGQVDTTVEINGILEKASININRGASLSQTFKTIVAQRMISDYSKYVNYDFICSMSALFDSTASVPTVIENNAMFIPFISHDDTTPSEDSEDRVVSFQKYFWTRVQRLPFAINPFDCSPSAKVLAKDDAICSDPYDFLYIFGCAGFRGSDYNEDSYNREKYRLNLGMLFLEDPYFKDSPAYRG